jgi:hypothetical protein
MQAVAITTTHSPAELAGEHVIAVAPNYNDLIAANFFALHT